MFGLMAELESNGRKVSGSANSSTLTPELEHVVSTHLKNILTIQLKYFF